MADEPKCFFAGIDMTINAIPFRLGSAGMQDIIKAVLHMFGKYRNCIRKERK